MVANSASINGSITSSAGNIGGWTVNSNSLTSANVGLYAPTSPASSEIAFFAGSAVASRSSAPFRVDYSGNVTVNNLSASGTINGLTVGFGNAGKGTISSNTALGLNSLNSNTTGEGNFAAGASALYSNTIGSNNFAIGNYALSSNISSVLNLAIGASALAAYANISILNNGQNTAIGVAAMQSTASAYSNIAVGPYALAGNPSINNDHGKSNIAIGDHALFWTAAYGATNNIAIGTYSFGSQIVSSSTIPSSNNVAVGSYALYGQGYSVSNVAIGANALFGTDSSLYNLRGSYYSVAVGANALQYDGQAAYSVAIGNNAFQGVGLNSMNSYNNNSVAIGSGAGQKTHGVNNSILIGINAGYEVGSPVGNIATDLIALGNGALKNSYESSYNIGIGFAALNNSPSTTYNIAVGSYSMSSVSPSATRNIALGQYSLNSISGTSSGNVAIGFQSMLSSSTVNNNVAIGYQVLSASVPSAPFTGSNNVAIGSFVGNGASAMYETVSIGNNIGSNVKNMGSKNVYIGSNVLVNYPANSLALNTYNVAIGYQALSNASAGVTNSVGIGPFSLQNITSGDKNIAIGYAAGPVSGSLSNTIAIGDSTTTTQNGQIIIGGPSSTASATQIAGASVNLGAWIPYSPSVISGTGIANYGTGGGIKGAYVQIGKTIHFRIQIGFGTGLSVTAASANCQITLPPFSVAGYSISFDEYGAMGSAAGQCAGAGFMGTAATATATSLWVMYPTAVAGAVAFLNGSGTAPRAWTSGDIIKITGTYEAA